MDAAATSVSVHVVAPATVVMLPGLDAFGAPGDAMPARLAEARAALPLFVVAKSWCTF